MDSDLTDFLPTKFAKTGLKLPEDLSHEDWLQLGKSLRSVGESVMWAVGDWLSYGEQKSWGDTYTEAQEVTGYSYRTLKRAKQISGQFKMGRRRPILSHKHHTEVAPLDIADQDELLDRAEQEGLSTMAVRTLVRSRLPRAERNSEMSLKLVDAGMLDRAMNVAEQLARDLKGVMPPQIPVEDRERHTKTATKARSELRRIMKLLREQDDAV